MDKHRVAVDKLQVGVGKLQVVGDKLQVAVDRLQGRQQLVGTLVVVGIPEVDSLAVEDIHLAVGIRLAVGDIQLEGILVGGTVGQCTVVGLVVDSLLVPVELLLVEDKLLAWFPCVQLLCVETFYKLL